MTIDAIIFDMDGVLIDTELVWDEVREAFTREVGGTWHSGAQQKMMGMSSVEWTRYMASELHIALAPDEISNAVVKRLLKRYHEDIPVLPGAVEAVRTLSERWPMAVASSSNRELIDAVLQILELESCFVATVSSEEVAAGKPDPAVYLEAARRLSVDPKRCTAVEDSSNGLRSAVAAGMWVVAVPNKAYPPAADAIDGAHVELGSLEELTAEVISGLG